MTTLLAYHGNPAVKTKYLKRVRAHRKADELVKGETGTGGKGCAVWCTLDAYDHARYEIELGIPQMIARLEDAIFEGLPQDAAMAWPERFLAAIRPGADLSRVGPAFLLAIIRRRRAALDPAGAKIVGQAVDWTILLLAAWVEHGFVSAGAAREVVRAAWAAGAAGAAEAAAGAAGAAGAAWAAGAAAGAARAAEGAARAAKGAARAAWAARAAEAAAGAARAAKGAAGAEWAAGAAAGAAGAAEWVWMSDELVRLLEAAP